MPHVKAIGLLRPCRRPGEWPQDCVPAQTESRCASVESCIHNEEIGPRADLFPRLTNKFDHCKPPIPGAITLPRAKHAPGAGPGKRVTRAGTHTDPAGVALEGGERLAIAVSQMSRARIITNIWACSMRSASSMPGVICPNIGRRPGTTPIPALPPAMAIGEITSESIRG
jgi:hypothetical protein